MSGGGSRFGAGRPAYRVKAEQLQRVEIGRWHRGGYLRAGASFTWSWNRGGDPSGSIGVRVFGEDSLILQYRIGSGDEWRDGTQAIRIDRTPCNYGKTRPWFGCPVCQRRAGVLYLRAGRFACRRCQRVSYTSQSCDLMDRTWRKQCKLEARLGDNWTRPKGMRHSTHERLIDALCDCEERRDAACAGLVARLFGHGALADMKL